MRNIYIAEMLQRVDDEISIVIQNLADLQHTEEGYKLFQAQRLLRDAEAQLLKGDQE